jgi:hypothetical protein
MTRIQALLVLCLLAPTTAIGDELELIGDRPDFTESNATIPTGHLQAEMGVEVSGAGDDLEIGLPKLLLRYGVVEDFELRLEIPDLVIGLPKGGGAALGAGAVAVGLKWVHAIGDDAAAGLIFMAGSPVTPDDVDAEGFYTSLNAVWGVDFDDRFSLGGNVRMDVGGLGTARGSDASVVEFTGSLALGIAFTDIVGMYLETFHTITDRRQFTPNADAGFTFLVTPTLQLDVYGGADVSDPVGGWFAGSGVIALF